MTDDERPDEQPAEGEPPAGESAPPPAEAESTPPAEAEEPPAAAEESPADEGKAPPAAESEEPPAAEEEAPEAEAPPAAEGEPAAAAEGEAPAAEAAPGEGRAKPEIPGADLEVDIVPEGSDPLAAAAAAEAAEAELAEDGEAAPPTEPGEPQPKAVPQAAIDLAADARYTATGKRKTAIARVVLRPGSGAYAVNGRTLEEYFPRATARRTIREPLETVGYDARMDVVASLRGGGVAAQAGALRHGIARALIEADPNLRVELKRRGLLTRDARVKGRRKAGLKKARKRPQFSKR
jgi:small subunit ribosomal protein S9